METVRKGHLPRLAPEYYRGSAIVYWTLTIERRGVGWLTTAFHRDWQLLLLHTCARYDLIAAVWVLMPDHAHILSLGLDERGSDQRSAIEFLRKNLRPSLAPFDWQHQAYDHVLDEEERHRNEFLNIATYILENPVRAGLVERRADWPYVGCCVPGYPNLDVNAAEYWEVFWRIYHRLVEAR